MEAATSADTYLLTRDSAESDRSAHVSIWFPLVADSHRLNEQHRLFTENLGYVVNPAIQVQLQAGARVADIAAGTGAWAVDAAANHLRFGAQVDAFDISDAQFPAAKVDGVTFNVHNAKMRFPAHLHGIYDMVHVRALVAAMDRADWLPVTQNIVELLKPGGFLQWTEADLSRLICLRAGPSPGRFSAITRLLVLFNEHAHLRTVYGAADLASIFATAGITDVRTDVVSSDRVASTRAAMTASYLVAMIGWARATNQLDEQALNDLRLQIALEVNDGAYIRGDSFTTVGMKPSSSIL